MTEQERRRSIQTSISSTGDPLFPFLCEACQSRTSECPKCGGVSIFTSLEAREAWYQTVAWSERANRCRTRALATPLWRLRKQSKIIQEWDVSLARWRACYQRFKVITESDMRLIGNS